MQYIRTHKTQIGFKRIRPSVGAVRPVFGNLRLRSLIIHEVRYLQQGIPTARSVYRELDAWQLEFGIYQRIEGMYPHPSIAKLMTLSVEHDRLVLQKAAFLMQAYAGKVYQDDLLSLVLIMRELKYLVLRN